VAHELRNPMTPILGQVERLRAAAERDAPEGRVAQGLAALGQGAPQGADLPAQRGGLVGLRRLGQDSLRPALRACGRALACPAAICYAVRVMPTSPPTPSNRTATRAPPTRRSPPLMT
jgi:hypothetical protein